MEKIRQNCNDRIEGLAKKVETRITKTVTKEFDSKMELMKNEMNDKMKNINKKLDNSSKTADKTEKTALATLKEEIGEDIDALADKIKGIEAKQQSNSATVPSVEDDNEIKRRFIIRNLAERDNENIKQRVNNLVYDGMRLDIIVKKAIRKFNRTNSNPGIVIATCKTLKDKESVMNSKKELKRSRKYENAFIEYDIPLQQRKLNSNLRAIVNTIGHDKLYFRGSHVLRSESQKSLF